MDSEDRKSQRWVNEAAREEARQKKVAEQKAAKEASKEDRELAKKVREDNAAKNREERQSAREAKREAKKPSARERAVKSAKKVAQWAIGREKGSVIGKYKPQIEQSTKTGNDRSGGAYTNTIPDIHEREAIMGGFGGFHNTPYGSTDRFSHAGFDNSPFSSPFSSGLNPAKKNLSWKPPF